MNMPHGFRDANSIPAEAVGGIGDVTSNARGSGARFNAGKAPLDLIPLRLIANSFIDPLRDRGMILPDVLRVLYAVGEFQETGDRRALEAALQVVSPYWTDCARVFDYGRKKYAAWNWAKGMPWSVPVGCIGRHALAILADRQDRDPETDELHMGHIACNVVMLALYVETYPEGNDLPPPELFQLPPVKASLPSAALFVDASKWGANAYERLTADLKDAGYSPSLVTKECAPCRDAVGLPPRRSVVVYGPQGCGKTLNAKALAEHFGLSTIVDDYRRGDVFPRLDALILTNDATAPSSFDVQSCAEVMLFDNAMTVMQEGRAAA